MNENNNAEIVGNKSNLQKTHLVLISFFVVIIIGFFVHRTNTVQPPNLVDNPVQSIQEIDNKVGVNTIQSDSIMVNPVIGGQWWATMYRPDPTSNKIYFVLDRSKSLLREIVGADPESFKPIASSDGAKFSYASDKNGIYCNDTFQPEIDKDTFLLLNDKHDATYAKDSRAAYANCKRILGADPVTFRYLGYSQMDPINPVQIRFASDKTHVYANGVILKDADPGTFGIFNSGYSLDATHLYYGVEQIGKSDYFLSKDSTGTINLISPTWNSGLGYIAVFNSERGSGVVRKIETSTAEGANTLFAYKNSFYFIDSFGYISEFNPETNTLRTLDLGELALFDKNNLPKVINFFINGQTLYFLYGQNCSGYLQKCSLDLMSIDLKDGVTKKILSGVVAREILGIDKNSNTLYMQWVDGDAGCFWGTIYRLNLNNNDLLSDKIGSCVDDKNYNEEVAKMNGLKGQISNGKIPAPSIYVKEGSIVFLPNNVTKTQRFGVYYIN